MTSRDVVNVVQRRYRGVKVGHAGTLDPLANGVLVLGVGPAVRLVPYVQQTSKRYHASFRLGAWSPSGDTEEEITEAQDRPVPTLCQLQDAAARLTGDIDQTPPAYSAIWIAGQRAYDRVRRGEQFEVPSRRVRVDSFVLTRYAYPEVEAEISCGSGTYIRSLGIDLARQCGTVALMTGLRRVAVGPFSIDSALPIEVLRDEPIEPLLRPAVHGVMHLPQIKLDTDDVQRLEFGQPLAEPDHPASGSPTSHPTPGIEAAVLDQFGRLRGIVKRDRDRWRPYRVFPRQGVL